MLDIAKKPVEISATPTPTPVAPTTTTTTTATTTTTTTAATAPPIVSIPLRRRTSLHQHHYHESYRIMTFNVRFDYKGDGFNRWKYRSNGVCKKLASYNLDVLCLQEALQYQFDDILKELNSNSDGGSIRHYAAVTRGREKNDRSDGKEPNEHCSVLYNSDKFTCLASGFFWLSSTPDVPGSKSWDADCVRIATWVVLDSKRYTGGMSPLLIINTHWDHMGHIARVESAKLIKRKILEIAHKIPIPIGLTVFTGDLNCFSDSLEFQEMLKDEHDDLTHFEIAFQNARDPKMTLGTFTGWHDECDIVIDHVLISDHSRCLPKISYSVITDMLPPKKTDSTEDELINGTKPLNIGNNAPCISVTPTSDSEYSSSQESPCSPKPFRPLKLNITHSPMPSEEVHSPYYKEPKLGEYLKKRRMSIPPTTSFANLEEMELLGYDAVVDSRTLRKDRKKQRKLSDHRPIIVTISL